MQKICSSISSNELCHRKKINNSLIGYPGDTNQPTDGFSCSQIYELRRDIPNPNFGVVPEKSGEDMEGLQVTKESTEGETASQSAKGS